MKKGLTKYEKRTNNRKNGVFNKQVLSSTEKLEEMEFNITKKKLEINKCKNAIKEL